MGLLELWGSAFNVGMLISCIKLGYAAVILVRKLIEFSFVLADKEMPHLLRCGGLDELSEDCDKTLTEAVLTQTTTTVSMAITSGASTALASSPVSVQAGPSTAPVHQPTSSAHVTVTSSPQSLQQQSSQQQLLHQQQAVQQSWGQLGWQPPFQQPSFQQGQGQLPLQFWPQQQ